jgi:hypothetical protein
MRKIYIQYQVIDEKGVIENEIIFIEATEETLKLLQKLKDQNTK